MNSDNIRPMPGWCLCRLVPATTETASGLLLGRDMEKGKTAEAVATVLEVNPLVVEGNSIDPGFTAGDRIMFREFLRQANTVGELVGEKDTHVFLLHTKDVMAVIPKDEHGTLGMYDEFVL
jgi:co-chaperonin GroES (HSP10)